MQRDVSAIMRPSAVAIIGASATRRTQGNVVIANLQRAGFKGSILPVHPTADAIEGLAVVNGIDRLPPGVDVAVVAIPASAVATCLADLTRAGVRAAVVFSNGFTAAEVLDFRRVSDAAEMVIHGPNCMGLIDFWDGMPLYPATITEKARPGNVALIAQSGSAAISLMNSGSYGLSTVVTMGSEFQVTAPDYLRFFATDDRTAVIGLVIESIQRPDEFAAAVDQAYAAGKSLAVLKVGRSEVGKRAVLAHTGALISPSDAYDRFLARCGVPTAQDYDELIATLECFASTRRTARGSHIAIVGISGGETALACDVAVDIGVPLATFGAVTTARITAALSGAAGVNPLDLGSTVTHSPEQDRAAIDAILDDDAVDSLLLVQDSQASLTPTMLHNYTPHILEYGRLTQRTRKPVLIVSPSAENTHPRIHAMMAEHEVPVLKGLRPGLVALRNLGILGQARMARDAGKATAGPRRPNPAAARFRAEIAALSGPLPADITRRILAAYDIPLARSAVVATAGEVLARAEAIGYPLVLKIVSLEIAHRSDIGGVELGIGTAEALRAALARMLSRVRAALPHAEIAGFEVQEHLVDRVEAMVGFLAAPPFGAVMTVGSGGTMVELQADHAVDLCPISEARAVEMIATTRLGAALRGYRNLIETTDVTELARLAANLSNLAADLSDRIVECDLNPVLIRKGVGDVRVVDALMSVARGDAAARPEQRHVEGI